MSSRLRIVNLAVLVLCWGLLAAPALSDTRIEKNFALAPGGRLLVDIEAGSVSVTGGSGSGCRVVVTSSRDDLDEKLDFSFEESAGEVRIVARRKGKSWFGSWSFRGKLLFEIEVPERTMVDLDTSGGSLEVDSIIGDVRLDTSGGGIRVTSVRGEVLADTSGGGITIQDVEGDVKADTSGGSIKISGAGGRVEADTSGGPIDVEFAPGNSEGGSLSTSGGGITVTLDAGANLEIDASTSGGSVRSDLPITVRGEMDKRSIRGTLGGGGATLKIRASGGGIRIQER